MTLMDVLIVGVIFAGLGLAIVSKLRQQNHPAYKFVAELIGKRKHEREIKLKFEKEKVETKWF